MQAPPHVAPEDALEWYFDQHIADIYIDSLGNDRPNEGLPYRDPDIKEPTAVDEESREEETETEDLQLDQSKTEINVAGSENSSFSNAPVSSPGPVPDVVNVVCTASLGCELDMYSIAQRASNVEFYVRMNYVKLRIRSPRASAVLSSFGRMMCNGTQSVDDAHKACRRFARIIQRLGYPVHFSNFKVHNLVVTYRSFPVSLERLYVALGGNSSYEPELFRGLFYSYATKITACAFATGAIHITGSSNLRVLTEALWSMLPALHRARIHH